VTVRDLTPVVLDPDLDPWERQPGETVRRFAQFATYRDDGRARTLRKVAETLTLSAGYVRQVAAAMRWVQRAEAFDLHRDRLHEAAWLEQRRQAADNDAKLLGAVMAKIAGRLPSLRPEELTVADLARLLDVTLRHRRALFGDPQMTVAVTGAGGDPLELKVAEFAAMGAEQKQRAIDDMVAQVQRRAAAAAGADDDDD
jgi:hypothetical protein